MQNIRILYAEDEQTIIEFVSVLFRRKNIKNVTFAKNDKDGSIFSFGLGASLK